MAAEDHDDFARDTRRSLERRRYEEAILAALDFDPELGPDVVEAFGRSAGRGAGRRQALRPGLRLALLAVVHVVFAVVLAELLSAGVAGTALAVAAAGWLACTVLIARAIFRAGRQLGGRPA